ncbi:hypothetical protein [Chengkuizengella sediminis]|nr:hypothetical protein [Chengkuizengella sediminis]NDI34055.1 hypothetical protein [Chengkuizengella sediminis]
MSLFPFYPILIVYFILGLFAPLLLLQNSVVDFIETSDRVDLFIDFF